MYSPDRVGIPSSVYVSGVGTDGKFAMIKLRIYVDTSVVGGCFDSEFKEYSNELFKSFIEGSLTALISNLTLEELENSPEKIRRKLNEIPEANVEYIRLTSEAGELAKSYIESGIFKLEQLADAQHIAVATVERADVIVSWNFKHIVNLKKIFGINSVNIREGYPMVEIRTPREVCNEKEDF